MLAMCFLASFFCLVQISFSQFLSSLEIDNTIQLYRASSYRLKRFEIIQVDRSFTILTTSRMSERKALVHHELVDSTWEDIPLIWAEQVEFEGKKYDMWKLDLHWLSIGTPYSFGTKFYFMLVNTNHEGISYTLKSKMFSLDQNSGPVFGMHWYVILNSAELVRDEFSEITYLRGTIYVKKSSGIRKVFALYSLDEGESFKKIEATFSPKFSVPLAADEVNSPNLQGIEEWRFSEELNDHQTEEVVLYCGYEAGATTYWDKNFNRHYKLNIS